MPTSEAVDQSRAAAGTLPGTTSDPALSESYARTRRARGEDEPAAARHIVLEREEHVADVLRTRRALGLSLLLWHAYLALDAVVATWLGAPPFSFFVVVRLAGGAILIPAWLRIMLEPLPSPRLLSLLDLYAYTIASIGVGVLSVPFGGLESPYCFGACIVLIGASVTRFYPWQQGVWRFGIPAASFVATMIGSALWFPQVRAQLHEPHALATFGLDLAYLATTFAFSVAGGHIVWSLRRQIFEARMVGRYRLKRRLGEGGMGEVWLAHHAALRRDVAVKILRPDRNADAGALARFEREVRATTELVHPNTVRIFDYGTTPDGLWFYAMEYLAGEDLGKLVKREGALAPARAVALVDQAARALAEAHGRGIVHRDVKPENLLLTDLGGERDFLKVLDFGIAKLAPSDGDAQLTHTGSVIGTPTYISPEAAAGEPVDARSDVYGLGAVLYFLLTGEPPFQEKSAGALLVAHRLTPAAAPSARAANLLSPELDALVLRCLAKRPDERFADGAQLSAALASCPMAQTTPA